jgi:hypothetical protein
MGTSQLTCWIRPACREHAENNGKKKIDNRRNSNWFTENSSVKWPRTEFSCFIAPYQAAQNGHSPSNVVASNSKGEQSVRGSAVDKSQEPNNYRHKCDTPDCSHRLVLDALADISEKAREWKCPISGKGPCLTRGRDQLNFQWKSLVIYSLTQKHA